jgi:hypothetical protein
MCVWAPWRSLTFYPRSYLKTHKRTHTQTHTFYGFDVFSEYALGVAHFGVTYTLPHCKALDIALTFYAKVHVWPTCITEMPLSERESERQFGGTERDRRRIALRAFL